jgi:hypothetical protein
MSPLLLLVLLVVSADATFNQPAMEQTVAGFFSLFTADCNVWAGAFAQTATFTHPRFGVVAGVKQLTSLCAKLQNGGPGQVFRQDGAALPTEAAAGSVNVLVPYVYASNVTAPGDPPLFINSGWEAFSLVWSPATATFSIASVTEFFDRSALAPKF